MKIPDELMCKRAKLFMETLPILIDRSASQKSIVAISHQLNAHLDAWIDEKVFEKRSSNDLSQEPE